MHNPTAITVGAFAFLGGIYFAIKMIPQELSEKLWKVIGIGAASGAIAYGVVLLLASNK